LKLEVSESARWKENTTSSALKGVPSWNFTFGRSLKRIVVAFTFSHDTARHGMTLRSLPRVTSVS
jgi:hypothetical protein